MLLSTLRRMIACLTGQSSIEFMGTLAIPRIYRYYQFWLQVSHHIRGY